MSTVDSGKPRRDAPPRSRIATELQRLAFEGPARSSRLAIAPRADGTTPPRDRRRRRPSDEDDNEPHESAPRPSHPTNDEATEARAVAAELLQANLISRRLADAECTSLAMFLAVKRGSYPSVTAACRAFGIHASNIERATRKWLRRQLPALDVWRRLPAAQRPDFDGDAEQDRCEAAEVALTAARTTFGRELSDLKPHPEAGSVQHAAAGRAKDAAPSSAAAVMASERGAAGRAKAAIFLGGAGASPQQPQLLPALSRRLTRRIHPRGVDRCLLLGGPPAAGHRTVERPLLRRARGPFRHAAHRGGRRGPRAHTACRAHPRCVRHRSRHRQRGGACVEVGDRGRL